MRQPGIFVRRLLVQGVLVPRHTSTQDGPPLFILTKLPTGRVNFQQIQLTFVLSET